MDLRIILIAVLPWPLHASHTLEPSVPQANTQDSTHQLQVQTQVHTLHKSLTQHAEEKIDISSDFQKKLLKNLTQNRSHRKKLERMRKQSIINTQKQYQQVAKKFLTNESSTDVRAHTIALIQTCAKQSYMTQLNDLLRTRQASITKEKMAFTQDMKHLRQASDLQESLKKKLNGGLEEVKKEPIHLPSWREREAQRRLSEAPFSPPQYSHQEIGLIIKPVIEKKKPITSNLKTNHHEQPLLQNPQK